MNDQDFINWYNFEATPDEKVVVSKIGMFEELFADMVFQSGTKTGEFLRCFSKQKDSADDWTECETDIPEEMEYYSPTNCKIIVNSLNGAYGQYNRLTKELTIAPEHINSDHVILHEMIHMYEDLKDTN